MQNNLLRLFCFPYAGGSEYVFRTWQRALPEFVEVRAVRLPGRGARMQETPYTELPRLVDRLAHEMGRDFAEPFAFFGHSMGALISFELARAVWEQYGVQPSVLFVSGRAAPHLARRQRPIHNLPFEAFVAALRDLDGTPAEVLDNAELMQLTAPFLRADLQMVETYVCAPDTSLSCPIIGFSGLEDRRTTSADMMEWKQHTSSTFFLHVLPGGHFFLKTAEKALLEKLSQELSRMVGTTAPATSWISRYAVG